MTGDASLLTHLECGLCGTRHEADQLQTLCTRCGGSLFARYDLSTSRVRPPPVNPPQNPGLWRFAPLLPVRNATYRMTLGEGGTPLLPVPGLRARTGLPKLWLKDEGRNPTGTFKARGLCAAVARAAELGIQEFAIPTAGNAGVALAAYAARSGARARVFVPEDAPPPALQAMRRLGAEVRTVRGLISDAGRACAEFVGRSPGILDVSTLKEPYRVEGKKTMGLELALHFGRHAPDVVVFPTGGGTGIIGIRKAFEEAAALGWTDGSSPRLVAVQAEGCAPIVRALRQGQEQTEAWLDASTSAAGLRVPKPFADRLLMRTLRDSGGTAVAVTEAEIGRGVHTLASARVAASPEGGAAWAGLERLVAENWVRPDETVVVVNTGSGSAA